MSIPRLHRNEEAHWAPGDRALARAGRLAKGAVLLLLIAGFAWIGVTSGTQGQGASRSQYADGR